MAPPTASPTTQIATPHDFAVALLQQGHFPVTKSNVAFIEGWAQREGGNWNNSAAYNPLNTTWRTSTSTNYATGQPSSGVQAYGSWDQGISATLDTLNSPNYQPITSALQSGNAMAANNNGALANSLLTWSGNSYTQIGQPSTSYVDSSGGAGTDPNVNGGSPKAGLMSDCANYRNSSAATSNCLVGGGGGLFGVPCVVNACQAKALVSGMIALSGGVLMLVGVALLFAGGRNAIGNAAQLGVNFIPGGAVAQRAVKRAGTAGQVASESGAQRNARTAYQDQKASGYKAPRPGRYVGADEDDDWEAA